MSAFGGIWGGYLPIIDALRDRLSILQVQLYNSGSMYGIDGGIYTQATADFIVSQTEAVLQGFTTSGGVFGPLPPEKVAIGLPACPSAAGGGYVNPDVLAQAVNYLLGTGSQPGSYTRTGTYPTLRGLMTWSINWDAVDNCAAEYEYAQAFEDLFGINTGTRPPLSDATNGVIVGNGGLRLPEDMRNATVRIFDSSGRVQAATVQGRWVDVGPLSTGVYLAQFETGRGPKSVRFFIP